MSGVPIYEETMKIVLASATRRNNGTGDESEARREKRAPLVTVHTLRERRRQLPILVAEDHSVNQVLRGGWTVIPVQMGRRMFSLRMRA